MYKLVRSVLDFISPRACVVCGRRLAVMEEVMCASCNWQLPRTYFAAEQPYENHMTQQFLGQFPLARAAGWFYYRSKDPIVMLIHRAKYYGDRDLCRWLGSAAATEFLPHAFFKDIDFIVPLPLTPSRQRSRGYNQCNEIAKGVSAVTGLPIVTDAVRRIRFERSQTLLHGSERIGNVVDAFRLTRPEQLRGKHILLLDDVVTTGATLSSCGREIALAGDVTISVMTIGVTR